MNQLFIILSLLLVSQFFLTSPLIAQQEATISYVIQPGDTWTALSYRLAVSPTSFMKTAGVVNPQLQPVIGSTVSLREVSHRNGTLIRPLEGGLLETAARFGNSPWALSLQNDLRHPLSPIIYAPVFVQGGSKPPREMPIGFKNLSISDLLARPGRALALQAHAHPESDVIISLDSNSWNTNRNGDRLIALGATGAFYGAGTPELRVQVDQHPLWAQPWLFEDDEWYYDQVSFAETPANEQEAMDIERERLRLLWEHVSTEPLWSSTFTWPLIEYVELTSHYGARRSVNGGPYDSYHEGTDYSAYRGTPVYAPAGGKVILAEPLVVRGGAVILDHGLGVHTGYYHLSEISVQTGDMVTSDDILGEVGSTGRSTGNHLHWDLLIGTTWVDAEVWTNSQIAGWIRAGWGGPFPDVSLKDMPPEP